MITLFSGENSYDSWKAFTKYKKELAKEISNEIKIINGDEASSISEFFSSSEMASFFTDQTIVFVKRLFKNRSKKLLESVAEYINSNDSVDLVIWEEGEPDKRLKLYKAIKKHGEIKSFKNLKPHQLVFWVRKQFEKSSIKVSDKVINKFISRVGTDQFTLNNEIDKLKLYLASEDKDEVTLEAISEINILNPEDSVWEFLDNLTNGNKSKSLIILENMVSEIADYQMFLGLIVRQLRLLMMVKIATSTPSENTSNLGIHPFVLKKLMRDISRYNLKRIKIAFERLLNLDKMIKTGEIDPKLGLNLFVITF